MQLVQDPSPTNKDNLNNVRRETNRYFRNKKNEYLKPKIEELETNGNIKNIRDLYRGINDFKQCYQSRTNVVKDAKGDSVANSHSIWVRWSNYVSQLLNVNGFSDVRQREIHSLTSSEWDECLCG
jgi:hypothetical protein